MARTRQSQKRQKIENPRHKFISLGSIVTLRSETFKIRKRLFINQKTILELLFPIKQIKNSLFILDKYCHQNNRDDAVSIKSEYRIIYIFRPSVYQDDVSRIGYAKALSEDRFMIILEEVNLGYFLKVYSNMILLKK